MGCAHIACSGWCLLQEDGMYEVRSHVKEQLKFLESIDRHSAQRKQEQEREKLLKAAKVSGHSPCYCQCQCGLAGSCGGCGVCTVSVYVQYVCGDMH